MKAIEVDHLVKKFGEFTAVNDVSFDVEQQEIFGLLGPNGAGKTTLIRMMTTLTPPTSGTARIGGHDIRTDPDGVRSVLGVIPQAFTSDPELTAQENMMIHAKLYGVPSSEREALIDRLLESVELLKFRDALVRTFSGGMRRRLEIARGLVHSPKIMFLDEPTTGLDPVSRSNVWEMIRKLRDHVGADDSADDALHGRGGQAVRPDRDRRSREIGGARHADEAEGQRAGNEDGGGGIRGRAGGLVEQLRGLAHATGVTQREEMVHITSNDGPATVAALMDLARAKKVTVKRVLVQTTTLDDVFLHYTGTGLRDALQKPVNTEVSPFSR